MDDAKKKMYKTWGITKPKKQRGERELSKLRRRLSKENESVIMDPETSTCPDCIDATGEVDEDCERCNGVGELFI